MVFRPQRMSLSQQVPAAVLYDEHEKNRAYHEGILQINHGRFTPLVFSVNDSMGRECQKFYLRLTQMNLK